MMFVSTSVTKQDDQFIISSVVIAETKSKKPKVELVALLMKR